MIERCARCGAPAGATMSYNYTERVVWLDDLEQPVEPGAAYPLCIEHGDRMTPPRGWTLTDRRATSRLFVPLEVA